MFSCLSRRDRIRTLSALENLNIDLYVLPSPFQNNAGLVKNVTDALNRFSMLGYYSEWPAYGSTRLRPPSERRLEFSYELAAGRLPWCILRLSRFSWVFIKNE